MPGMLDPALDILQAGGPGVTMNPTAAPQTGLLAPTGQQQSPEMQQALKMLQTLSQNPQAMAQFGGQMQNAMQAQMTPEQRMGQWMQGAADMNPDDRGLASMASTFRNSVAMADKRGMTDYMNILKSAGYGQGDMSNASYNRSLNRGD